jgi:hypothetical protein
MEAAKKAIESNDSAAIQRALDQLTSAQHKAAESLYRQQAAGPGAAQPGEASSGDGAAGSAQSAGGGQKSGDVIDAEVVDEGKQ